jgi:uncharacterized protein YdaU (DUF1376 family)
VGGGLNYWARWISAIKKRTATLSLMEMGAYDRLLDHYYAEEGPLPADVLECCRIAGAVTKPEQEAVRKVLQRFFVLTAAGHTNERADEEIQIALPKIEAAKANGSKGGRPSGSSNKPNEKPIGLSDGLLPGTHEEPTTKHPHPHSSSSLPSVEKKKRGKRANPPVESVPAEVLIAAGFDGDTAAEFIAHKVAKDAPLTARAWADHQREAAKIGWTPLQAAEKVMARGWKGFEAKYVETAPRGVGSVIPINRQEAIEQRNRAVGEEWLRQEEAKDAAR